MKIVINTQNAVISIDDSNNDININVLPVTTTDNKPSIEVNEHIQEHTNDDYSQELFHKLSAIRRQIAIDEGLPSYIICKDKTLIEMCKTSLFVKLVVAFS
jgi:superfamily II DNA helicase RecQ